MTGFWVTGGHRYHAADCRVLPSCVTREEWTREEIATGRQAGQSLNFRTPLTPCRICAPEEIRHIRPRKVGDSSIRRGLEQVARGEIRQRDDLLVPSLTEFLLAQIADDEEQVITMDCNCGHRDDDDGVPLANCPERVLAECEAKRRIVEWAAPILTNWPNAPEGFRYVSDDGLDLLKILALPYADHPDFREEWRH